MSCSLEVGYKEFLFFLYFISENKRDLESYTSIKSISNSFKIDEPACKKALTLLQEKSLLRIKTQYTQSQGRPRKVYLRDDKSVGEFLGIFSAQKISLFLNYVVKARKDSSLNNFQRAIVLSIRYFECVNYLLRIITIKELSLFLGVTERRVQSTIDKLSNQIEIERQYRVLKSKKSIIISSHKAIEISLDVETKRSREYLKVYAPVKQYGASLNFELYKTFSSIIRKLKITKEEFKVEGFNLTLQKETNLNFILDGSFSKWTNSPDIEELLTYQNLRIIFNLLTMTKDDKDFRYYVNEAIGIEIVRALTNDKQIPSKFNTKKRIEDLISECGQCVSRNDASVFAELINIILEAIISKIVSISESFLFKSFESKEIYLTFSNPIYMKIKPTTFIIFGSAGANKIMKNKCVPTLNLLGFDIWKDKDRTDLLSTFLLKFD